MRATIKVYLKISVDEVVDLEVFIVVTPWVEKSLCDLDPAEVANELQDWEPRKVDGRCVVGKHSL